MEIACKCCGRKPEEILYYINFAENNDCTPEEAAMDDGTYNPVTGKFYCNRCYIELGMPLGTA